MSYFVFDNIRIYYNEFGEGTPLLFLHGNTASSDMLIEFAEKYKNDFKIVLIDFLGHGRIHLFNSGGHPAMLTNQTKFYEVSMEFLK